MIQWDLLWMQVHSEEPMTPLRSIAKSKPSRGATTGRNRHFRYTQAVGSTQERQDPTCRQVDCTHCVPRSIWQQTDGPVVILAPGLFRYIQEQSSNKKTDKSRAITFAAA